MTETETKKPYKLAIVIGRFQIFHNGHKGLVDHALSIADKVLVIIGSSNESRTRRNPFTYGERKAMIRTIYPEEDHHIGVASQADHQGNDDLWKASVDSTINTAMFVLDIQRIDDVAIVGHKKDETSFYLDLFPEYQFVAHEAVYPLNSTDLRKAIFGNADEQDLLLLHGSVPASVLIWLLKWIKVQ